MSVLHPSQLDWNEIENKLSKDKKWLLTWMEWTVVNTIQMILK
jgi:hypothetical protein